MVRLLAFNVAFFVLPFAGYAAWLVLTRGSVGTAEDWPFRTVAYLALAGAVTMIAALIVFISFTGGAPGTRYVPARIENGVIVPGRFE